MPLPRIAIVGRPNVGKSSLVNMLARRKVAIVDPTPGVTRDRVSTIVELDSPDGSGPVKQVEVTDTGGYGVYVADDSRYNEVGEDLAVLREDIEHQIGEAVRSADLILFAIDCQVGETPQDAEIAKLLREQRFGERSRAVEVAGSAMATDTRAPARQVPVRVVATKCDGPKWEAHAFELASLGFGEPLACSAASNYFRRDFVDELYELLPEPDETPEPEADLKIAIVGKRNAGKSTLVNTIAGQKRVIVSEIAGTTRDAVDVKVEYADKSLLLIDTAGQRRKKSFQDQIEWYAFDRAKTAIDRADVVLHMIDAQEEISQVDEQIAALIVKAYKPVIIVLNKWDMVAGRADDKGRAVTPERFEEYVRKALQGLSFAPIAMMSAEDGTNVRAVVDLASELHDQASERVSTGVLNRLIEGILERRGPTSKLGTQVRVYYAAQVAVCPPTIVLVVNRPDLFTDNYRRYLLNRFRETLPFEEVPIKLLVRGRKPGKKGKAYAVGAEGELTPEELADERLAELAAMDAGEFFDDESPEG
jgi:GTP-binding protein